MLVFRGFDDAPGVRVGAKPIATDIMGSKPYGDTPCRILRSYGYLTTAGWLCMSCNMIPRSADVATLKANGLVWAGGHVRGFLMCFYISRLFCTLRGPQNRILAKFTTDI